MAAARPDGPAPMMTRSIFLSGIGAGDPRDAEDEIGAERARRRLEARLRCAGEDRFHRGERRLYRELVALRPGEARDDGGRAVGRLAPEQAASGRALLRGRSARAPVD